VTVPSLPGCISEGDTFDETLKNIKEALVLNLEVMKKSKNLSFLIYGPKPYLRIVSETMTNMSIKTNKS
jgi:predicted RNase H-like HicB family nuclease